MDTYCLFEFMFESDVAFNILGFSWRCQLQPGSQWAGVYSTATLECHFAEIPEINGAIWWSWLVDF